MFIPEPVADGRDLQGGQGIQITGGQPAQTAVAQARLHLKVDKFVKIQPQLVHGLSGLFKYPQIEHVVEQVRSFEKFSRKIGHHPGLFLQIGLNGMDVLVQEQAADGVRHGLVEILWRSGQKRFSDVMVQIFFKGLFYGPGCTVLSVVISFHKSIQGNIQVTPVVPYSCAASR